jgi:AcrR family transcriptional regulator
LSREGVLRAAMRIADEGGLDAVTMGRIGEQVGAEAMSLYRHVRNKDDVLDGMVDLVFGEIEVPAAAPDWKTAMRERAQSGRAVLRRHPWAIGLMESRSQPGPANMRHHDAVLGVLAGAGFSSEMATHAYNLLDSFIYGFALQERGMPFGTPEEMEELGVSMFQGEAADAYPHLKAVAVDLIASRFSYGDEFAFGLDLILDGIERSLAAGS